MKMRNLLAIVLLLSAAEVSADVITVAPGEDLQEAIDLAVDGDVIQLEAGDYYRYNGHEIQGKSITIRGVVGSDGIPLSRFPNPGRPCFEITDLGQDDDCARLENLLFDGGVGNGHGWMLTIDANVVVTRCHFQDWSGFAGSPVMILTDPGDSTTVFVDCIIGEDTDSWNQSAPAFIFNFERSTLHLVDCRIEPGRYPAVIGGFRTDPIERGDVDGDGDVDTQDLEVLRERLGTCVGDLNMDGEVSGADLGLVLTLYGRICP